MGQSIVPLNNRHTTGRRITQEKYFKDLNRIHHTARYYGRRILIGLFAQTMHISNTAICGEINCPNTRLSVKLEASHMEIEILRILWTCPRFSGFVVLPFNHADFQLWNNANETDMAAKLTNSNHGETAAVWLYCARKMEDGEWVRAQSVARTPCPRRKHAKCRFLWVGKRRGITMAEFTTSTTTRSEHLGSIRAIG